MEVAENPVKPEDLNATIAYALGLSLMTFITLPLEDLFKLHIKVNQF